MKKHRKISVLCLLLLMMTISIASMAQLDKKDRRLVEDAQDAKKDFIHTDSLMKSLFASAYAYAIFPTIGKGGFLVGGAGGDGVVFQQENALGKTQMGQL